jgi:mono/diheme cytochrome c family protein
MGQQTATRSNRRVASPLVAAFALLLAGAAGADAAAPAQIDFNRDVRPILSDNCFACHGFDKAARKAELRLDTREGLFTKRPDAPPPVVPGKPDDSEVMRRLVTHDPDDVMPPAKFNKTLTPEQIATIRRWIEHGAVFQGHWAYIPPVRPAVPAGAANPVDAFVGAVLAEKHLARAAQADRVTLFRRLSFDLTGLPPRKADVDAFVNDKTPDAYEKLVDRLLASPAYGERMALYWLDVVRYADSAGYHSDNPIYVWPYRDYVIKSFNANKPFDRFTTEQLAGDLLPNATNEQRTASTYNRLLQTTEEGGAQAREYIAKYAADRVRNVSATWLGQTMGCAECHDHKFDPLTQRDFYSMAAFFADIQEPAVGNRGPGVAVPDEQQLAQVKALDGQIAAAKAILDKPTPELAAAQAAWEASAAQQGTDNGWVVLKAENVKVTPAAEKGAASPADALLKQKVETYTVTLNGNLKSITGIRLEALADPALSAGGPGAAENGNFVLTNVSLTSTNLTNGDPAVRARLRPQPVKIKAAAADHSQDGFSIARAIDDKRDTGWAVLPQVGVTHTAVFELAQPLRFGDDGADLTVTLEFKSPFANHHIAKPRLSVTGEYNPVRLLLPEASRKILAIAPGQRSDKQRDELAAYYRSIAPSLQAARDEVAAIEKRKAELVDAFPKTLVTTSGKPRTVRILARGNWQDESGPEVQPAFPVALTSQAPTPAPKAGRLTRLDLAKWLTSADNPLAARVFVNRVWKLCFGQGISKGLEDLGSQGEWPTHPELLDYLAVDFRESGWDVKRLVKLLVMSETYRQTSRPTAEQVQLDPFNRLYARQSRYRLDAETVRDNALAVSGLLVEKLGGKSVFPYQPKGYWAALNFPAREWKNGEGEDLYRRGLYTHWQRSFLHPSLLAFDAPSREECTVDRPRSNIPQQALALLNDPTYVEASRIFAGRIMKEGGADPAARIKWAFGAALSRDPSADELRVLADLQSKHLAEYKAAPDDAKKLLAVGAKPADASIDPAELASWASVARTILNLHETITRR